MKDLEPKQVIIIRKDLNMRKGKMCVQASYVSMKVILDMMSTWKTFDEDGTIITRELRVRPNTPIDKWINGIFKKIVVGAENLDEMMDAYNKAKKKKIPCSLIEDSGLTEFGGVPTITAVAIGPSTSKKIDKITEKFKLL